MDSAMKTASIIIAGVAFGLSVVGFISVIIPPDVEQQLRCATGVGSKATTIAQGVIHQRYEHHYSVKYKDTPIQYIETGMMDLCVIRNIPAPVEVVVEKKLQDING